MWPKVCESKRKGDVGGLKMCTCECWCPANSRVMVEVCRHRPLSFCDVLRHTDGSWHNTDRLHPLAPTLTPPFPLQNGCSLSPARLYVLSIVWFDRHSINAKSIITPSPPPGFHFLFFFFLPPLLLHISLLYHLLSVILSHTVFSHRCEWRILDEILANMQRSRMSQLSDFK